MRFVRIRLSSAEATLHPLVEPLTDGTHVTRAEMWFWNMGVPRKSTVLLVVDGDEAWFADRLERTSVVDAYDTHRVDEGRFYAYVHSTRTETEGSIVDASFREGLLVAPPICYWPDGTVTMTLVGPDDALQAAVDAVPDDVDCTVDRLGDHEFLPDAALGSLSARQREALVVAYECGYYDTPRTATREDVAQRLDCAPSTASEHLRRAETNVLTALLDR